MPTNSMDRTSNLFAMETAIMILVLGGIFFVAYLGTKRVLAEDNTNGKSRGNKRKRR